FGEPLGEGVHAFPSPERLAALEPDDLAPIRAGFRARYLVDAARKAASGEVDLPALAHLPLEEARGELRKITGVGAKVAECALLYGCGRVECVPIDVWVRRVLDRLYPDGLPACARGVEGLAQQYLFHAARTCPGFLPGEAAQSSDGR
ncbi:MAG: DNA-3-methyladenine glycosylase family protein, partial [Anaerotruncus massiliensis (ex Togo et al. 2019)]